MKHEAEIAATTQKPKMTCWSKRKYVSLLESVQHTI